MATAIPHITIFSIKFTLLIGNGNSVPIHTQSIFSFFSKEKYIPIQVTPVIRSVVMFIHIQYCILLSRIYAIPNQISKKGKIYPYPFHLFAMMS